ncbi:hypothetical protein MRX96_023929 [Rhipicephalus microplus]
MYLCREFQPGPQHEGAPCSGPLSQGAPPFNQCCLSLFILSCPTLAIPKVRRTLYHNAEPWVAVAFPFPCLVASLHPEGRLLCDGVGRHSGLRIVYASSVGGGDSPNRSVLWIINLAGSGLARLLGGRPASAARKIRLASFRPQALCATRIDGALSGEWGRQWSDLHSVYAGRSLASGRQRPPAGEVV